MEQAIAWCIANPEISVPVALAVLDAIGGAIPDGKFGYKGFVRRLVKGLSDALEK